MGLVKRWKIFFNKEDFDYSEGLINPYEFHETFYVLTKLFRVLNNETIPQLTILTPLFVSFCGVLASFLCLISLLHAISELNVPLITESGTYFIIMIYKLIILSSTKTDLKCYHNLLNAMRDDFKYICTEGSVYRKKYLESHLLTFKASVLSTFFTSSIGCGMVIFTNFTVLLYFINKDSSDSDPGSKPLPFPFWVFDLEIDRSPIYEIIFLFSNLCIVSHCYTYIFMMQTQIVWVRQVTCKADVIIWSIQDLLVDIHPATTKAEEEHFAYLIKSRIRHIIKMHQSMFLLLEDYAGVYKKFLIFEQTFAGPVVCLTAFCAAERQDKGEIPGILILLCVSVIVLVFIPSYLCTYLAEKVLSISNACWSIPFWNAGPVLRPYLVLIMQRSRRPLPIQAAGFKDFSLETFANTMTTAYSCFNMLRQSKFDI